MNIVLGFRGVAQLGRAPRSGRGSRRFKSCHLDQQSRFSNLLFYYAKTPEARLNSELRAFLFFT